MPKVSRTKITAAGLIAMAVAQMAGYVEAVQPTFDDPTGSGGQSILMIALGLVAWFLRSPLADIAAQNNDLQAELRLAREALESAKPAPPTPPAEEPPK